MSQSMQQLRRYTGSLPHNHGYDYLKSAVMGKAVADDSDLFECIKNHSFYEFIPCDPAAGEEGRVEPLLWSELQKLKGYRLLVMGYREF